jgi:hypothetical protein
MVGSAAAAAAAAAARALRRMAMIADILSSAASAAAASAAADAAVWCIQRGGVRLRRRKPPALRFVRRGIAEGEDAAGADESRDRSLGPSWLRRKE